MRLQFARDWEQANELDTPGAAAIQAIKNKPQTVGALCRSGNKDLVTLHITEAVATYVSMLPPARAVTAEAVIAMGKAFTELPDLRHLTLAELKTFLAMAFKRQHFGKLYGGFGYDTLLEWFNHYLEARATAIIDYRENEHNAVTAFEKGRRTRSDGDSWGVTTPGDLIKGEGDK